MLIDKNIASPVKKFNNRIVALVITLRDVILCVCVCVCKCEFARGIMEIDIYHFIEDLSIIFRLLPWTLLFVKVFFYC